MLPAVENKRSGSAEVAGIASTRLANTPNQGKRCTVPRRHLSRGFLSLGKGTVRVFHILISLSAISALESSRQLTAVAAEAVTKKSLTAPPHRFCMFVDGQQLEQRWLHAPASRSEEILCEWFIINFVGKKKGKKLTKILYYRKILNLSCAIKYGTPDMRPVPVFSENLVKLGIQWSPAT